MEYILSCYYYDGDLFYAFSSIFSLFYFNIKDIWRMNRTYIIIIMYGEEVLSWLMTEWEK